MSFSPGRRAIAAAIACVLVGCEGTVTVPGLVTPGSNRPPVIAASSLTRTGSGLIKLTASVFDPDGDGLTVRYEQRSGPFAAQQSALLVGGAFSALLKDAGEGTYAFRLFASDGFFDTAADVHLVTGGSGNAARVEPRGRPISTGRFRVRLSGRAIGDEGLVSFAQDATLEISDTPAGYAGDNEVVLTIRTHALPTTGAAPAGSLNVDSAGPLSGSAAAIANIRQNDAGTLVRLGAQTGPLDDLLDIAVSGGDLIVSGPAERAGRAGVSAAQFRSAESRPATLDAGSVWMQVRRSGDRISGNIYLAARGVDYGDLPRLADYSATFTGTADR